jgi:hypothetical protein
MEDCSQATFEKTPERDNDQREAWTRDSNKIRQREFKTTEKA